MVLKKIAFSVQGEQYFIECKPKTNMYVLCKILDDGGAEEIKTCTVYETIDDLYVQGRSTRNLPSIPSTQRQLELF